MKRLLLQRQCRKEVYETVAEHGPFLGREPLRNADGHLVMAHAPFESPAFADSNHISPLLGICAVQNPQVSLQCPIRKYFYICFPSTVGFAGA